MVCNRLLYLNCHNLHKNLDLTRERSAVDLVFLAIQLAPYIDLAAKVLTSDS